MAEKSKTASRPRGRIPSNELAKHEEALLRAAAGLFLQHGFVRVSIGRIARAARVSTKTIYARFGGKSGLFTAVVRRELAPRLAIQTMLAENPSHDPISMLKDVSIEYLSRMLEPSSLSLQRMAIGEATQMPEIAKIYYAEAYASSFERLAQWMQVQLQAGRMKFGPPHEASQFLAGLVCAGVIDRALLLNEIPSTEAQIAHVERAIDIFSRYYILNQ
ncbi:MAG TPA: TetR/AcrR family transcriptional regulator [Ancylobacter sp.]